MNKLGSHVGFKSPKYLVGAVEEALSYNATAMMIYLGAPQNTRRKAKEEMLLDEYNEKYANIMPRENILVHAPYIINPSSVEKHEFAIEFLIKEIEIMNYLGLKQIVLHPGAHTKWTREEGIETVIKSLKKVINKTNNVEILLETMAGKGTEIGRSFEELKQIIDEVGSNRIKVCLDTCHIWDGGYDVNDVDGLFKELKRTGLYEHIEALHINDSKNELGAHKDRHANLEQGHIKIESLKKIINHKPWKDKIMVLETPWIDGLPPYKKELQLLHKK